MSSKGAAMLATDLGTISQKDSTEIRMVGDAKGTTRAKNALAAADGLLMRLDDSVSVFAAKLLERLR